MNETEQLRKFAQHIMQAWPEGDVDGGYLQDTAIDCGLIREKNPAPTEPCGEFCACAEYYGSDEFSEGGVRCYQPTQILTGQPMSPNA